MAANTTGYSAELARRYRVTSMTVNALFILTLLLVGVGYVGRNELYRPSNEVSAGALSIAILIFAVGAIVLRRTRFQAMRLQDIAALEGISGLLRTLQNTTLQVAFIALAVVLMGLISTMLTASFSEVLRAGVIATVILIYSYPRKGAWERVVHGIVTAGDANDPAAKEVSV